MRTTGSVRTPSWRGACAVGLGLLLVGLPVTARAEEKSKDSVFEDARSLLHGYSVTGGVFYEGGRGELSGWNDDVPLTPTAMGFRYYERNGLISGTIGAIAVVAAGAMAASSPKSVETRDYGNYRVTTTTYRSQAEQAAIMSSASQSAAGLMGSPNQSFDLQIYSRTLGGNSSGYRANLMFYGIPWKTGMFDIGLGFGSVKSAMSEPGKYVISQYSYFGMPMRVNLAVGPVLTYLHWDWNWLSHRDRIAPRKIGTATTEVNSPAFPWRLGAAMALFGRLYLDAAVTTPHLTSLDYGVTGSMGMRF